jgi:hypothetical protein
MDLHSAGWADFVANGKLDPRLTFGTFTPGQRIYPRNLDEMDRWSEIITGDWEHPSKWHRGEIVLPKGFEL